MDYGAVAQSLDKCNDSLCSKGFFFAFIVFPVLIILPSNELAMIADKNILWNGANGWR